VLGSFGLPKGGWGNSRWARVLESLYSHFRHSPIHSLFFIDALFKSFISLFVSGKTVNELLFYLIHIFFIKSGKSSESDDKISKGSSHVRRHCMLIITQNSRRVTSSSVEKTFTNSKKRSSLNFITLWGKVELLADIFKMAEEINRNENVWPSLTEVWSVTWERERLRKEKEDNKT
jgi:hypothetical protein